METESRKQTLDRSAVHLFGESGMTILPWTKQMLCVLWEQLRFLVHLICYSFMSGKSRLFYQTCQKYAFVCSCVLCVSETSVWYDDMIKYFADVSVCFPDRCGEFQICLSTGRTVGSCLNVARSFE